MLFLDHFSEDEKELFQKTSVSIRLARSEYLIHRGDPGGDLFLLTSGGLDVVDSRKAPETIIATLKPGLVVGEMAFIDNAPRGADVRANQDSEILKWGKRDLKALLLRNPPLSAKFYKTIAKLAVHRVRTTSHAMAPSITNAIETIGQPELEAVEQEARRIASITKESLMSIERIHHGASDQAQIAASVNDTLNVLQDHLDTLFHSIDQPMMAQVAANTLQQELHPFFVHSTLAARCIRRKDRGTLDMEILSHVLKGIPEGEGKSGPEIDKSLLSMPTLEAHRQTQAAIVQAISEILPTHRNRRIMLVNAGTGSLANRIVEVAKHPPTTLTILDQSWEALDAPGATGISEGEGVSITTIHENLARFAMGRVRNALNPQDMVILHGLIEYLPDRLVVSLFKFAQTLLSPDGVLLVAALGHSSDEILFDRLLDWPSIRRDLEKMRELFAAASLEVRQKTGLPEPAMLFVASPPQVTKT